MKLAALAFDILLETGEYISVRTLKEEEFNRDTLFLRNVREDEIASRFFIKIVES